MQNKAKHPCTPDCPRRDAFCRRSCKEWQEYEAEHMADVAERERQSKAEADVSEFLRATMQRNRNRSKKRRRI